MSSMKDKNSNDSKYQWIKVKIKAIRPPWKA